MCLFFVTKLRNCEKNGFRGFYNPQKPFFINFRVSIQLSFRDSAAVNRFLRLIFREK